MSGNSEQAGGGAGGARMREILESVRVLRSIPAELRAKHESVETLEQKFGRWQKVRVPELPLEQRPYNSAWPRWFEDERERIAAALGVGAAIEHYGSTSIPGMSSKNIVDIAVALEAAPDPVAADAALGSIGYAEFGNSPIDPQTWWYWRVEPDRAFVIHLCGPGRPWFGDMLDLRDYLRAHADECERYMQLKQRLLAQKDLGFLQFTINKMTIWIDLIDKAKRWRVAMNAAGKPAASSEEQTTC